MPGPKKSSKADRKRKSGQNGAYKLEHRHEKSHIRRIKNHVKRYGVTDNVAVAHLMRIAEGLGINAFNSAKEFVASQRA
jgi:hypothetical protein